MQYAWVDAIDSLQLPRSPIIAILQRVQTGTHNIGLRRIDLRRTKADVYVAGEAEMATSQWV